MRNTTIGLLAVATVLTTNIAHAEEFESGSYVIPMDTDYQDAGMLRAYGLVYDLLRQGVPVRWVVDEGKNYGDPDFTTVAQDVASGDVIPTHAYRGGPWVIAAADAAEAEPIIEAWIATYPETTVHQATEGFAGDVSRYLVIAPTLAMVADGNEDIARGYMVAAGIPDSALSLAWDDDSPDMLDIDELSGPTENSHTDGALFDEDGDPRYCQLMSMHWGVGDAEDNPEVVAEVRAFLNNPTHFFAECQAVNAFENLEPHGFFLTPNGFEFGDRPDAVDFHHADSPFGQLDGEFETVGGSEPSYTLPPGDAYKAGDIVMLTAAGTPEGEQDVWMTGFLDGQCPPEAHECGQYGKISYLGGHEYSTDTPMSAHWDAQGTRLFLNSLFEAPCATVSGLPTLAVAVDAPAQTTEPAVTLTLSYVNSSFATALDAQVVDTLPAGATFVAASGGGVFADGLVRWDVGNLGPGESGDLTIDVQLDEFGVYENSAALEYRVGLTPLSLSSNVSETEYGDMFPQGTTGTDSGDGLDDSGGTGGGIDSGGGQSGPATSGAEAPGGGSDAGTGGSGGAVQSGDGCGCTAGPGRDRGLGWLAFVMLAGLMRRRRAVVLGTMLCGCTSFQNGADGEGTEEGGPLSVSADGLDGNADADSGGIKLDLAVSSDILQQPELQEGCQAIDFLFIIDSSESMKDHQDNLIASFPGFAAEIQDSVPAEDWHVMVVDTDAQWGGAECANACTTLGSCPEEPGFDCQTPPPQLCDITIGSGEVSPYGEGASNAACLPGAARYVAEGQEDLAGVFSCVAQVGVDGNSEERTAEAMTRALDPEMVGGEGCNAGFLRDEAILVVTVITDEPDSTSPGEPAAWANALIDAKLGDPEAVVVLGLLPDGDADGLCQESMAAPRLGEFVAEFPNSARQSVCEPDYSPFFAAAVDLIVEVCDDFEPPPPAG